MTTFTVNGAIDARSLNMSGVNALDFVGSDSSLILSASQFGENGISNRLVVDGPSPDFFNRQSLTVYGSIDASAWSFNMWPQGNGSLVGRATTNFWTDDYGGTVRGTVTDDFIAGGAGNDFLSGSRGDDSIYGNGGSDNLFGDEGRDVLAGGDGIDWLYGGQGDDWLYGGIGDDFLDGGAGADALYGESGHDYANYFRSSGVLADLQFADVNSGDAAGDIYSSVEGLIGSATGADNLRGDGGNNNIYGNGGNDLIWGRAGDDAIWGGRGNDQMAGEAGRDSFYFTNGDGHDLIWDFEAGEGAGDVLMISTTLGISSFADVQARASQVGSDTVINLGEGTSVTLWGVSLATLAVDDVGFFPG